ncbi:MULTISPECIES: hypothetical protein [unclassified Streptomyces]|uniref:hypothetical protein n=1 Tax=unclassified Streptomyces TaxID=2593676 RepID=UPI0033303A4C
MVSVTHAATHAAHDIEVTTESLQEDLARLQIQKQALERELAAVVAHLGSVQRALGALETLMRHPVAAVPGTAGAVSAAGVQVRPGQAVETAEPHTDRASAVPADTAADTAAEAAAQPRKRQGGKDAKGPAAAETDRDGKSDADSDSDADSQRQYGKLTEQIMEYFAGVGDADVRARDVAAALGRDTDSGSINGVRSTLDRLVGTSRVQRTGRGLYRARRS